MTHPLFSQAYRPFFLVTAGLAVFWMLLWLHFLGGGQGLPAHVLPMAWHGHEMLFGFAAALLTGFVLTAAENWTGERPAGPGALILLLALWLAGRIGFLLPGLLSWPAIAVLDLLFLPAVAVLLGRVLIRTRNRRNLVFLPLLTLLTLGNLAFHLAVVWRDPALSLLTLRFVTYLFAFLLVFMGGRVIPFFTTRRLPGHRLWQDPRLNWAATLAALTVALLLPFSTTAAAVASGLAGVLILARWLAWRPWGTWREPLLWILHLGYGWLAVGYLLQAVSPWAPLLPPSTTLHAFTVGALGALGLGMMARVALGHSGRALTVGRGMTMAFVLISVAALWRLLSPLPLPLSGQIALSGSGVLWSGAFLLYLWYYVPIFWRPRQTG